MVAVVVVVGVAVVGAGAVAVVVVVVVGVGVGVAVAVGVAVVVAVAVVVGVAFGVGVAVAVNERREKNMGKAKRQTMESEKLKGIVCQVGAVVLICTVTRYFVGRIVAIDAEWICLADAAWVSHTGRFHDALAQGIDRQAQAEVEPVPGDGRLDVARGAITDCTVYPFSPLRAVK